MVSGRHLRLSGAGSKPPAAPSLKAFFLFLLHRPSAVLVSSAFGFFGICGGRARRAASSHAASDCATDTARRAAPHGRVGVRARTAILAFGARDWPLASSASAARGVEPRRVGLRDGRGTSSCAARSHRRGFWHTRLTAACWRARGDFGFWRAQLASGFFGICGGHARRAASRRAASDCATGAARRTAPRGRVGDASGVRG